MASYTENYALTKPTMAESADIKVINSNMDTVDDVMHSTQVSLAPAYDMTETYNTGDVVMYELLMYECLEDEVTGTWDATKWQRTTAGEHGGGSDVEVTQIQTEGKAVASIAVDGVSTDILVPELKVYGEATGDLITIEDAMEAPLEECKVTLEPQQDLHGYDSPWIGGAGKNKFETKMTTQTKRGITATVNEDGSVTFTGTTTSQQNFILNGANIFNLPSGEYILTAGISNPSYSTIMGYARYGGTNYPDTGSGVTITVVDTDSINFYVSVYPSFSGTVTVKPMIRLSSISDNTWQPYSNICPISGWDEANVNISPTTSAEDGTTYPIDLNGTRYGGTLDVVSGVLKVTDGYIASYNGETLPSTWISDRDVYAPNTSPTTGAEVVYKLITTQTIQLTPTAVKSLLGTNNIWADGEMYVKYRRDIEMLLQRIADSLGGSNA